jgi:hypothetical protein
MMGGKYSAEWWEKIAGMNREISSRHNPSSLIGDVIQANGQRQAVSDHAIQRNSMPASRRR